MNSTPVYLGNSGDFAMTIANEAINVVDIAPGNRIETLTLPGEIMVEGPQDGMFLVARGDTTYPTVSIYDATTGEWGTSFSREAPQYVGDSELVTNPLSGTALTPDGTQVLTTLAGTELMLVDVETGSVIHRFEEHDILVTALAISPEGTKAVSGDPSGRLMLWDLASGELLHQLEPVEGSVYTLEFGSNSERLYGSALDTQSVFMSGQRHVQWQYHSLTELINWACTNRIIVPLRDEERRRFRIGDATDPCIG